jgi:hypothetical protein
VFMMLVVVVVLDASRVWRAALRARSGVRAGAAMRDGVER